MVGCSGTLCTVQTFGAMGETNKTIILGKHDTEEDPIYSILHNVNYDSIVVLQQIAYSFAIWYSVKRNSANISNASSRHQIKSSTR